MKLCQVHQFFALCVSRDSNVNDKFSIFFNFFCKGFPLNHVPSSPPSALRNHRRSPSLPRRSKQRLQNGDGSGSNAAGSRSSSPHPLSINTNLSGGVRGPVVATDAPAVRENRSIKGVNSNGMISSFASVIESTKDLSLSEERSRSPARPAGSGPQVRIININ